MAFSSGVLIGQGFAKRGFDYIGRPIVAVPEQMPIDVEGDGRGGMAQATADRNRVHACGDQLARMGVAKSVQAYRRQFVFGQSTDPFPRSGIGTPCRAIPARKNKVAIGPHGRAPA